MEIVKANRENLASILMGKNIQFPWRGQRDLIISIPFAEWKSFIQQYKAFLSYRPGLNYDSMLKSENEGMQIRYFMYDISWALYSELACSSNIGKDATLILPYFEDGRSVSMNELINELGKMDDDFIQLYYNKLKAATRNYYNLMGAVDMQFGLIDTSHLSQWNEFVFKVCIYLQSKSSNKFATEKFNIDWRISKHG